MIEGICKLHIIVSRWLGTGREKCTRQEYIIMTVHLKKTASGEDGCPFAW